MKETTIIIGLSVTVCALVIVTMGLILRVIKYHRTIERYSSGIIRLWELKRENKELDRQIAEMQQ